MSQILSLIPDRLQEVSLQQTLKAYLLDCDAKNLSRGTILWYEAKLKDFIQFLQTRTGLPACPLSVLTEESIRLYIQHHKERENPRCKGTSLSSTTVKGTVIALKVFLKFLHNEGYLKDNLAAKIKAPKVQKKIITTLSPEHIKNLLSVPNKEKFSGYRDYCILLTFLDTGVRLNELVNMRVSQLDFSTSSFVVLGKGNKERRVPFGMSLRKTLEKYLMWRGDKPKHDFLFVNQFGDKMDGRRIQEAMTAYGRKAGFTGVRMSPHTLRHTFAKQSILNGMDAITLQYILGHTSLDMVRQYVNLTGEDVALQRNRISLIDRMGIQEPVKKKKLFA